MRRLVRALVSFSGNTALGRYVYSQILSIVMGRTQIVNHAGLKLIFSVLNALCRYRADTFSTKEPSTLEWIDEMPQGCGFPPLGIVCMEQ
jgi:hypothetical protein